MNKALHNEITDNDFLAVFGNQGMLAVPSVIPLKNVLLVTIAQYFGVNPAPAQHFPVASYEDEGNKLVARCLK